MTEESDVFRGYGVEVDIIEDKNFLKIKETLTRVGHLIEDTVQQPCFLLHKKGNYAILHHHELLNLDGVPVDITEEDIGIRNTISCLLEQWGLINIIYQDDVAFPRVATSALKIVPFRYKKEYTLVPLYEIGKKV